ncbi:hypothetical protein Sgly_0311 [Syntrophobotulus glycolicus DSM 8271]|uniref:Uncharacterized protein n=1 Tax=Syntrophobotulus glycolicus (strain DSM 8271 / FlGlyR) TaxID=645991 RepID=F0SXD2_SYNGF|nr:hypothetical protein [Syntrophobotulus glycolicus]ADY54678.1 hypothetical protein Sgly_0311 [Syntrophobotulus glycolicus DSM 8271]
MNSNKLKAAMALYGDTGNSLASALSLSPQRFSSKLNEKNGAEFTQREIQIMAERYALDATAVFDIFFNKKVS